VGDVSVVINTLNEEDNLPRALSSIKNFADEIVVVDMKSDDGTQEIAEKAGARVYEHKRMGYVEPARSYAIQKAKRDWILVLDADEEVPKSLAKKLKKIIRDPKADYYRLPRKNIIFGRWMQHAKWWPDHNIRFFKKGSVSWNEVIHSVPMTSGKGADLPAKEEYAIIHHNYDTLEQYLARMNRYTSIQARVLTDKNYRFIWKDLISKPTGEFVDRYFAAKGYKDGLHGLALSLLQAFSEAMVYLKVWQEEKFLEQHISLDEATSELKEAGKDIDWWMTESHIRDKKTLSSLFLRLKRKLSRENV
jgi:(heptosyl)LPS beta-1,4-glucosyltransferase